MDSARWNRVQTLFHETITTPPAARRSFLESVCDGDSLLVEEVMALAEADASGKTLLDEALNSVAGELLIENNPFALPTADFGPYRIRKFLGEGGMGVVYLADRPDLGNQVAIKILRDAWMSPARRERFANEQRTLAQLNHPSIARLYDADTLPDGTPWFAMEYVEGVSFTEFCRTRRLEIRGKLQLFRSICQAVQFAHSHAIIHRDLKPSNILVREDGSIRLLDFGIARHLESGYLSADSTRTGLRMMTPAYAAPEVVRGQSVGVYTDVYSLGTLLYELLTGRAPFNPANRSSAEMETLIVESEPERPSAAARNSSALDSERPTLAAWSDLDVLCTVAMHKSPERRYPSVEALIRDVNHFLDEEPLEARPDSLRYRTGKFLRRNRRSASIAAVTLFSVVALSVFFTVRLSRARNVAVEQAARAERIQRFMLELFDGGDKTAGPSEDLRVVDMLSRGEREARVLSVEPGAQAELYSTLGAVYQNLGKFDKAGELLTLALNHYKSRPGNAVDAAMHEVSLGMLRADQARLQEAENLVRAGLETLKRLESPLSPHVIQSTVALGKVLEARGEYSKGIELMDAAVKLQEKSATSSEEFADSLAELANHHFYAGHYDLSDSLNRRVLEMYRRFYGPGHPKVASVLVNLGASQHERGHYKDAENYHRQALAIYERFYGPDHPDTASSLTLVARALVLQNRADEAEELLKRALLIRERVYGKVHPAVASTVNELGNIAVGRKHYADAEADFQRMIDIYRTVYHDHHYLIGIAESNLANVYLNENDYARAEGLFRDALRRFIDTLSPEHLNTGIARIKLGRTLLREKRYTEAGEQTRLGYQIVSRQTSPSVKWLDMAKQDLAELQRESPGS
jgi:serine/threonine-protein kinase